MESLLRCKEKLSDLYCKYDIYINSLVKFLIAATALFGISMSFESSSVIGNPGVVLLIALACMFMPRTGIMYITGFYALISTYFLSMEYAIVFAFIMLLFMLLYMQFSPEYGYIILLSALACSFNLPVMMAVLTGIFVGPAAIVPVACGCVVYYILSMVPDYVQYTYDMAVEGGIDAFKYIADSSLLNKEMYLSAVAMVVVVLCVFIIKRLRIRHSWKVAALAGVLMNVLIMLIGGAVLNTSVDVAGLLVGAIISAVICLVVIFFARNLDYKHIERVQFEDEEYYYYVKAIPKKTANINSGTVKRRVKTEIEDEND